MKKALFLFCFALVFLNCTQDKNDGFKITNSFVDDVRKLEYKIEDAVKVYTKSGGTKKIKLAGVELDAIMMDGDTYYFFGAKTTLASAHILISYRSKKEGVSLFKWLEEGLMFTQGNNYTHTTNFCAWDKTADGGFGKIYILANLEHESAVMFGMRQVSLANFSWF